MLLPALDQLDDVAYGLHLADWEASLEECANCGRPRSECSDPDRDWFPQRTICYATRQREVANRLYDELHDDETGRVFHDGTETIWSKKFDRYRTPVRFDDGVNIWVAAVDMSPDDTFLQEPRLLPTDDEAVGRGDEA